MRVEPQRFFRMTARFGEQCGLMVKIAVATLEHFGETRVSQGKSRVQRDCVSVALFGRDEVVARDLRPHLKLTAAEVHDIGIRIVGQLCFHLRLLLRAELRRQSSGDFRRQLALQSDRILQCTIVTVRPDLPFGRCVGQLHINQHAICSATNATLENGSNAKFLCNRAELATGKIPI